MKHIFFMSVLFLLLQSCNEAEKKEDSTSARNMEMKSLYEKNLATLKSLVSDFEKEDFKSMSAHVADTAVWNSPAYGDTVNTKAHWMESLKYYMDNWSDLHLTNGQFLPGIDSATHEFDGSVRYYGRWDGVHSSGVPTKVNYYGTYEFNSDNKIISGSDFFDLGGMMNALKPATK